MCIRSFTGVSGKYLDCLARVVDAEESDVLNVTTDAPVIEPFVRKM